MIQRGSSASQDRGQDRRQDRYGRQELFAPLGRDGQERLARSAVALIGCGALGSHVAQLLVRAGVGRLRLVDRDVVEWSNLHRQVVFTESDAQRRAPKAATLAERLAEANSEVTLEAAVADFNHRNALELTSGADLIVDGSDNVPTRLLINDVALETGRPWVYGGAVGEHARAQLFAPGSGPCLRCLIDEPPAAGSLPTCDTAGVLGPAAGAAASLQSALALRALAQPEQIPAIAARLARLTVWNIEATTSRVERDPECAACVGGARDSLEGNRAEEVTVLCGRDSVQVIPAHRDDSAIDLAALAVRLESAGEVEVRPYLLRFAPTHSGQRMIVFADSRAIIEGTRDATLARVLYDRYIGQ